MGNNQAGCPNYSTTYEGNLYCSIYNTNSAYSFTSKYCEMHRPYGITSGSSYATNQGTNNNQDFYFPNEACCHTPAWLITLIILVSLAIVIGCVVCCIRRRRMRQQALLSHQLSVQPVEVVYAHQPLIYTAVPVNNYQNVAQQQ